MSEQQRFKEMTVNNRGRWVKLLKDNLRAKIPAWFFSCRVLHQKLQKSRWPYRVFSGSELNGIKWNNL